MDKYHNTPSKRRKALLLSIMLPISLLVILGLAARPGSAENEEPFTTYLANLGYYYSGSQPMLAAASSDDVGEPVSPELGPIMPLDPVIALHENVQVTVVYTDQGYLDKVARWNWGDGNFTPETVSGVVSQFQASHKYSQVGIYTVEFQVIKNDTPLYSESFEYVAVYDPSAGFVTGGGWIDSPERACQFEDCTYDTTGKANFGFVSKYKKGATVPTGNTEFQFKTADLNFHSDSYDFLVVAGHKAQFKGVGTINGAGNYGFMISAIDEKLTPSTDVDKFRIKIWDKDDGDALVYDNQVACSNTGDDADPCWSIGGGSIVIHKGK